MYDLDARVMVAGRPEPLDFLDHTVLCITRKLRRDAEREVLGHFLEWWRQYCAKEQHRRRSLAPGEVLPPAPPEEFHPELQRKVKSLYEVEKRVQFAELKLLIEWDRREPVRSLRDCADLLLKVKLPVVALAPLQPGTKVCGCDGHRHQKVQGAAPR